MIVNIKRIDDLLRERVVSAYDSKSLNDEVDSLARVAPCLENLLLDIRSRLDGLPTEVRLTSLCLEETPTLWAELSLEETPPMITVTRVYEFAAAHRLHSDAYSAVENVELYGKCWNPAGHGHNYVLEVTVSGTQDADTGMILDLSLLDEVVEREVVGRYDHRNLNVDIPEFEGRITTSEVVSQAIWDRLEPAVPGRLERVRLHETARNIFEVSRA
jgi:6-pyruvoyltetrahydropterin/6-carboxytetrahydropterin synthase